MFLSISIAKVYRKEKEKEFISEKDMFSSIMAIYQQHRSE